MVPLSDVCLIRKGSAITRAEIIQGDVPVVAGGQQPSGYHNTANRSNRVITVSASGAYAGFVAFWPQPIFASDCSTLEPLDEQLLPEYLFRVLKYKQQDIYSMQVGMGQPHVYPKNLAPFQIPLPPLEMQKEIVAEIEGYQKVIDGARAVLDNYQPKIPIHPDWPIPSFEDAPFQIIDGDRGANYPSKEDFSPVGHCLFLNTKNVRADGFRFDELEFISVEKDNALRKGKLERGDVILTTRGTVGNTALYDVSVEFDHVRINSGMLIFRPDASKLLSSYLFHFFQSDNFRAQREAIVSGAAQPQLPIRSLNEARIPLPSLATQQAIVAEIEAEQALVNANRELINRFEKKIKATLARIWGEEETGYVESQIIDDHKKWN